MANTNMRMIRRMVLCAIIACAWIFCAAALSPAAENTPAAEASGQDAALQKTGAAPDSGGNPVRAKALFSFKKKSGTPVAVKAVEVITGGLNKDGRDMLLRKLTHTVVIIFLGYLLMFVLTKIVNRQVKDIKPRHLLRKAIIYTVNAAMLIFIFILWIHKLTSITIFISVVGAGLALALQEVILCVAGWVFITLARPFESGDRIEMGGVKGDVIDIRLFQTSLLEIGNWVDSDQSTGRLVNIPNSFVFKKEHFNYTRGFEFIWNEIKILVTFESDWRTAEKIMLQHGARVASDKEDAAKQKIDFMTRRYMIKHGKLTPIVYVNIKDSGVELTLRYLTEAKGRRTTQDELCRAILEDFGKEEKVNFAYTTYRIVK